MKEMKYIIIIVVILVGGALLFRFWALNNFNSVLSDMDKENTPVYIPKKVVLDTEATPVIPIIPVEGEVVPIILPKEILLNNKIIKDEIVDIKKEDGKVIDLIFTSPAKDANLYIGCKYSISISSSSVISSINMSLYDFGTRKVQGPIASGIPKDITGKDIKSVDWKVGNVWPGKYFISTLNINGQELSKKSLVFNINKIPEDIKKSDIEEFCKNN